MEPGWYRDPLNPHRQRYWWGGQWSSTVLSTGVRYDDGLQLAGVDSPSQPEFAATAEVADTLAGPVVVVGPSQRSGPGAGAPELPPRKPGFAASYVPQPQDDAAPARALAGWWLPLLVAGLSLPWMFLPMFEGTGAPFEDDWGGGWPWFVGVGLLVAGSIGGFRGRTALFAVAAGAATYMTGAMVFVVSLTTELASAFDLNVGAGTVFAGFATAAAAGLTIYTLVLTGRFQRGTTPLLLSLTLAAGGLVAAVALIQWVTDELGGTGFWENGGWVTFGILYMFAPTVLLFILPLVRANAPALGFVAGYAIPFTVYWLDVAVDDQVELVKPGLGALVIVVAGLGGVVAFLYDRVRTASGERRSRNISLASLTGSAALIALIVLLANLDNDPYRSYSSGYQDFSAETGDYSVGSDGIIDGGSGIDYGTYVNERGYVGSGQDWTWTFRPSSSGSYTISAIGVDGDDTTLGVYRSGSRIIWDDDSGGGLSAQVTVWLDAGQSYQLVVSGYNGRPVEFDLIVDG